MIKGSSARCLACFISRVSILWWRLQRPVLTLPSILDLSLINLFRVAESRWLGLPPLAQKEQPFLPDRLFTSLPVDRIVLLVGMVLKL